MALLVLVLLITIACPGALLAQADSTGAQARVAELDADIPRPELPNNPLFPPDCVHLVRPPQDTSFIYHRIYVTIVFYEEATGREIYDFLDTYEAEIVGGSHLTGAYNLRFPDPGPAWEDFAAVLDSMQAEPAVLMVVPNAYRSHPPVLYGRLPTHGPGTEHGARQPARDSVPLVPPDSIPAWIYAPDNLVPFLGDTTVRMARNVISVRFQSGTTQAERQAAIDLVDGEVVGGNPFMEPMEGYYYVRVRGDSTGHAAGRAAEILQALPQVGVASIVLIHPFEWIRLGGFQRAAPVTDGSALDSPASLPGESSLPDTVPPMAPDSIPDSMWAPENIVPFLGVPENRVLRNVVSVRFKSGTHQAERQAAIDLIGGEVIGGKPAPPGVLEGTYYVQIAGDSTGRAAVDAADRLEALPQVSNANFVLLTRPEDWLPWRLPDDSSDRNSGRVSGPSEPDTVPAVAPDTLPADLYRPENIRYGSACISGASLRGTVVLRFRQGTSQAQKQAAADLVGGVVIGGRRPTEKEGYYFIRVMDGENGEALCNAIDRLNELPQVGFASHEVFVSTFGREPDDQAP